MPGTWSMRWLALFVCGALTAFGCTADTQGETGSLALQLVINGDTEIDEVDWTITLGEEVVKSGTINTSANGATASVEAYGLEPGDYSILMEAVSTDGETTCKGKAMFSITIGEVTVVHVMLNCKLPSEFGGVRVDGEFNLCPVLSWAHAQPMTTSVGNQIDLSAVATDEDDPIETITYMWSSGSGMGIADPMAADTTYTCTEVGPDTITILVTDDGGTYCMSMHTFDDINCVPADGDPCEGVICDDTGNECTTAACNPSNGICETSNVADGTDCDGDAGTCMAGSCEPKDLCMNVVCDDDGNECTAEVCNPSTGLCETSNVGDGTPCGDGGACMGGTCREEDLCLDVVCDDTGNDCTVGVCNNQTGICDPMNVTDGTACNDDTGTCVAGVCEVGNQCDTVTCDSGNDCVDPGTCNPSNGMCEGGGPEPINTPCDVDGVCDGAGTCVECNDGSQCPADGNQCTMASCDLNVCGQSDVMNGQVCDLVGTGDGMCEDGTCVAVPDCTPATAAVDCEDGDPCTVHSCPDGMCVTMPEEDGVSCDAAGTPGACVSGVCVADECQVDGDCPDDDGNECTAPVCDTASTPSACGEDAAAADGNDCNGGAGTCNGGVCEAAVVDPPAAQASIPNVCTVGGAGAGAIVQLGLEITMDPGPIQAGQTVDVEFLSVVADISQTFLQGAIFAVPSLETAFIESGTQATVGVATGGTGPDQTACPGCTVPGTVVVPLESSDGAPGNTSGTYNCYETNTAAGETTFTTTPPTLLGTKACGASCGGGPTTCAALDPDGPGPLGAFPLVIAPSQLSITPAPGTIATYSVTGAGGMDELCFETVGSGITTDTFLDVAIIPGILEAPIFCGPGILNPDDSTTPLTDVNRLCFEITP